MLRWIAAVVAVVVAVAALYWFGARGGWFGRDQGPGAIEGAALPADVIAARTTLRRAAGEDEDQIWFGDLHVHTTLSADAFQLALPLLGGVGTNPLADACDFARYCSAVDFWASTDHAESITPKRWDIVKNAVRACQKVAGEGANPDLVSFIGFEWTQVGRTPELHHGHHNVIFRDLEDAKVSPRPIAAGDRDSASRLAAPISPFVPLRDFANRQTYFDFNRFMAATRETPSCDPNTPSDKLGPDCIEWAARPGELVRKLFDEQKLKPLIIPHGTSWGLSTPPGSNWAKALHPDERADKIPLIEVYSGHGNSEEYRSWSEVLSDAEGRRSCPAPAGNFKAGCWRAGELIEERCLKAKLDAKECAARAAKARQDYIDMNSAGHLAVPGTKPEDWLDSGQCTDCFLPAMNYRPGKSVQAGVASTNFDDAAQATRFHWGFIGSSDTHGARPGTGYKQVARRGNTDTRGPIDAGWRSLMLPNEDVDDEDPHSQTIPPEQLLKLGGLRTREVERQGGFFTTGGLAAVHAKGRSREAIWDGLERRETYATSGQKILLWFHAVDKAGAKTPMGSRVAGQAAPTFQVRAIGAFKQKPGCPSFAKAGLDEKRIAKICNGECDNPSDVRSKITRIEVVKIRPQATKGEQLASLIQDRFIVHQCEAKEDGSCTFTFTDPSYAADKRDALYYVKAIQEAEPMINADPLKCERDASGKCIKVNICYGDYRSGASDCTAPAEPRAWSSPIYVDYKS
jgi:Protein of unknown function (DUF3604)